MLCEDTHLVKRACLTDSKEGRTVYNARTTSTLYTISKWLCASPNSYIQRLQSTDSKSTIHVANSVTTLADGIKYVKRRV